MGDGSLSWFDGELSGFDGELSGFDGELSGFDGELRPLFKSEDKAKLSGLDSDFGPNPEALDKEIEGILASPLLSENGELKPGRELFVLLFLILAMALSISFSGGAFMATVASFEGSLLMASFLG